MRGDGIYVWEGLVAIGEKAPRAPTRVSAWDGVRPRPGVSAVQVDSRGYSRCPEVLGRPSVPMTGVEDGRRVSPLSREGRGTNLL